MTFKERSRRASIALLLTIFVSAGIQAQTAAPAPADRQSKTGISQANPQDQHERPASAEPGPLLKNLAYDQKIIWTSPFRAKIQDLNWLVPMIGFTAGMIDADAELSSRIDTTGTFSKHATTISNAGLAAAVAGGGGLYLLGKARSDDHQQEAGIIAGEAAINSVIVAEVLKMVARRERPIDGTGQGRFFESGSAINSSFPSVHAMMTWSIASAVSHEYPGPLTQTFAYGLATGVSLARVYGKNHFPSDVIAGATMGWLIGRQAYASHHRSDLPGGGWGTFHNSTPTETASAESQFSAYVPLDSWVYPAFDRLAGLGVINSNFAGLKPWTRAECARLLGEAQGSIDEDSGDEGSRLYASLAKEFSPELNGEFGPYVALDSVYARYTGISNAPLTDSYHFGQTIVNDFGRPYQKGGNGLGGFSASGSSGALGFYIRGEYEHAPSAPGFSQTVQDAIQATDGKQHPVPAFAIPTFDQFRLLDTYISLNLNGWATSFGKETLWLGPTRDPFLQSNNAEPMYMFRVDQTTPKQLPSFLKYLGPYRFEFWVGKMTGHHFVDTQGGGLAVRLGRSLDKQPMVNGTKVNFKPTPNFEFGVGRSGMFGGPDFPITAGSLRHVLFSTSNAVGRGQDPGDRRSTFDFSYRLPGIRKWLTLYEDSFVEDEISPIGYPRRAAHNPGLYLSHVPGVPRLDMRVEAAYTNLPGLIQAPGGGFFYWNVRYLDGYTNKGNIVGNATVGRQGIALRGESTYWVASDKTIQFGYRSNIADSMFLEGGNLRDGYLKSEWALSRNVSLSSFLQYEWWNFPLLSAGQKQHDFTASFQLTYWPHWRLKGGR